MTSMWKLFSSAKIARMIFSMFSFSLYVGIIMMLSLGCMFLQIWLLLHHKDTSNAFNRQTVADFILIYLLFLNVCQISQGFVFHAYVLCFG